jgi:MerR family glutamine synthetase transcriptional repressor
MPEAPEAAVYSMRIVRTLTGLSDRQIRYYDQCQLVVPARTAAGHRFYSPSQVNQLREIKALLDEGLTIAEVKATLERRRRSGAHWSLSEPDVQTRRDAMTGRGAQSTANTAYVERRLGEWRPR